MAIFNSNITKNINTFDYYFNDLIARCRHAMEGAHFIEWGFNDNSSIANYIETEIIVFMKIVFTLLVKYKASKYSGNQIFFSLTNIFIESISFLKLIGNKE